MQEKFALQDSIFSLLPSKSVKLTLVLGDENRKYFHNVNRALYSFLVYVLLIYSMCASTARHMLCHFWRLYVLRRHLHK
jgi:hypothetical protein